MDEDDWLLSTDPRPMLDFLEGQVTDRKLRLFACACARRVWRLLEDERSRTAVETAERYADGSASAAEIVTARAEARSASRAAPTERSASAARVALYAVSADEPADPAFLGYAHAAAVESAQVLAWGADDWASARNAELRANCDLLRDLVGNPFRPITIEPAWVSWEEGIVRRLARAIYTEGRFEDLPILADALEEAGCTGEAILDHCRGLRPHTRGCWLLDRLLGKE